MPTRRLTEITVRALKSSDRYISHWDDLTPGFCVRVGKRTKTFCVVRGRQRERVSIGQWPDLSVAEARAEAKRLLSVEPEARSASRTFAEAREEFLEKHYADKGENTKYQVTRSLRRHFKALEKMQLADIDDADISRSLDQLTATPSEQLHAFRYLRAFFRWCVRPPRRYLKHSPMEGYEAPAKDGKRQRILSDEEIVSAWNACKGPSDAAVRLLLLWGTRRAETCVLRPLWRSGEVLTIPGAHTKNNRDHAIPICPLAAHVLPSTNHSYYLPGRWGEGHLTPHGLSQVARAVRTRSGATGWTPHDLRRTFRSLAARVGVRKEIAEMLMNHAPSTLEDIYDRHTYLEEKREALMKIEAALIWLLAAV